MLTFIMTCALLTSIPQAWSSQDSEFLDFLNEDELRRRHVERMLILGILNSPADAAELENGRYDEVYASSPDGLLAPDILRSILTHLGVQVGNQEGPEEVHVDELDAHSQGVDYVLNQLGDGKMSCTRLNLIAPPGGRGPGIFVSAP